MQYFVLIFVASLVALSIQQTLAAFVIGVSFGWLGAFVWRLQLRLEKQSQEIKTLAAQLRDLMSGQTAPPASNPAPRPEMELADLSLTLDDEALRAESPPIVEPAPFSAPAADFSVANSRAPGTPQPFIPKPVILKPSIPQAAIPQTATLKKVEPSRFEGLLQRGLDLLVGYFTGGNVMVRVGVLILFFGVAFLLKYAAERTVIPVGLRYLALLAGALAMLVFGWRLRIKNPHYALVLQGGAMGVVYLVVFAAYQLHGLLSPAFAMILLLAAVVFAAVIAIAQNAIWLAAMGVTGGFLAPILASSGSGSHTSLFAYYLILNLGIAAIAFYRSWRLLNWLGFAFTFGIGTLWGARFYQAEFFATTEPFLLAFFLLYTLIALLFAIKQPPNLKGLVDGTLVFGTPVGFMALQAALLEGYAGWPYGLALSSLLVGLLYLALAWFIRSRADLRLLWESWLALAVAFLTLAIPMSFDGRVTSAMWAIEGAALIWVGLRQDRWLSRLGGLALMLVSALFYVEAQGDPRPALFMLNADFVGSLLVALAALVAARFYREAQVPLLAQEKFLALALLLWGYLWWFAGGLREIDRRFNTEVNVDAVQALLGYELFVALSAAACWLFCRRVCAASVGQARALLVLGVVSVLVGWLCLMGFNNAAHSRFMLLNLNFASAVVLAGLCLWMAWYAWRAEFGAHLAQVSAVTLGLLWLGTLVLLAGVFIDVDQHLGEGYAWSLSALSGAVLFMAYLLWHQRTQWDQLTQPVLALLPLLALTVLAYVEKQEHLSAFSGWIIFPLVLAAHHFALYYLDRLANYRLNKYRLGYLHLATVLLVALTLAWQIAQLLRQFMPETADNWVLASWALVWVALLAKLRFWCDIAWPMQRHARELGQVLPRLVLVVLALWMVMANLAEPGRVNGLYLPLLNPLDLANLAALASLMLWLNRYDRDFLPLGVFGNTALAAYPLNLLLPSLLGFLWLNAALLRAFHYLLDIPFEFEPMFRSLAVESGLSILWGSMALVLMVAATRMVQRALWLAGAALMGLVVLKLFFVDMAGSGSLARIVSFLSVAGLCLVVGYLAPVPPRQAAESGDQV